MKKHVASIHKTKAAEHKGESALWDECQLQTYFTRKGRIDYFVVVVVAAAAAAAAAKPQEAKGRSRHAQDHDQAVTETQKALFEKLEEDHDRVKDDVEKQASIVHDFGDFRSARVP